MKYIPVIVVAAVLLAIITHSWIIRNQEPSKTLLILTSVLVLAPLASRIKAFGLLDFQKSVDRLDNEISETKKEVSALNQNIQILQQSLSASAAANSRQDQTININLRDAINPELIERRAEAETEKAFRQEDETPDFVLSPAFRSRAFLQQRLAIAIGAIKTALFVHHAHFEAERQGYKKLDDTSVLDLELPKLISFFREKGGLSDKPDDEDIDYLNRLEELIAHNDLLISEIQSITTSKDQLVDDRESGLDNASIRESILESERLKGFFLYFVTGYSAGVCSALWSAVLNQQTES